MMAFIMLPAILGLVILAYSTERMSIAALTEQMESQLSEIAIIQASEIDNIFLFLHNVTDVAGSSQSTKEYLDSVNDDLMNGIEYDAKVTFSDEVNASLKDLSVSFKYFSDIILLDMKGTIVAHSNPSRLGKNIGNYAVFQEAVAGKRSIETRMLASTGGLGVMFATPIMSEGTVIGVSVGLVNLNTLYTDFLAKIKFVKTANAYVYDETGKVVMYMDPKYMGTDESEFSFTQDILAKKSGSLDYVWNDIHSIAFFEPISTVKWTLVIAAEYNDVMAASQSMSNRIIMLSAFMSIVIGIIIYFVAKGIAGAMRSGANLAVYVSEGNFELTAEQEVDVKKALSRGDEISDLATGMGIMIENIASMVKESEAKTLVATAATQEAEIAKNAANEAATKAQSARREGLLDAAVQLEGIVSIIASASDQLGVQIEEASRGAQVQAERVTETATAMEEMNSTVLEVARNASASAELTEATRSQASAGAGITKQCRDAITLVREDSIMLRTNMNDLAGHAQSINTVMGVISDIADQTNLLALNAAIEAARAGDAGRGFAVVADEVRKLAEKTIASTTDVGNAIAAIQKSTEVSVKQVDMAVQRIEHATEFADASGVALDGIREIADQSADGVRAIATASEEQSATSEEIANSISMVNSIANETSISMGEAASAVQELTLQAQELSRLVDELKRS